MEGAALDRKLDPTGRMHFAVATHTDDAAIRRLLRDNPMRGSISLAFEREPDYFRGADLANGNDQTILGFSDGRLACMGRCTGRRCWVNGHGTRVGYLAELRLDGRQHGRFGLLREGYRFFHELQRNHPMDLYFTSIAADNQSARSLFERGARGLPAYTYLAELETVLVGVPRGGWRAGLRVETATPDHVPEMLRILNGTARRYQLAAAWDEEILLSTRAQGLSLQQWLLAFDGAEIVACGALWDQRSFRQTVIRGYSMPLSLARPVLNAAGRLLGWPRMPRAGSTLAHAFVSPLAFAKDAEALLPEFIGAFFDPAMRAGAEFITLALPARDERLEALRRRFATRTWRSRLYRVEWPGQSALEMAGTFLPEVALL